MIHDHRGISPCTIFFQVMTHDPVPRPNRLENFVTMIRAYLFGGGGFVEGPHATISVVLGLFQDAVPKGFIHLFRVMKDETKLHR